MRRPAGLRTSGSAGRRRGCPEVSAVDGSVSSVRRPAEPQAARSRSATAARNSAGDRFARRGPHSPDNSRMARASAERSSSPCPWPISPFSSCAVIARDGQRRTHLARHSEGDRDVLEMERQLEAERVVVGDHPAAAVLEHPRLGRAAGERLDDLVRVQPGLDRQNQPFRNAEVGAAEDHLVDGLGRLSAPIGPMCVIERPIAASTGLPAPRPRDRRRP